MKDELIFSVIGLVCLGKWFYGSCKGCKEGAPLFSVTSHSSQSSLWDSCFLVILFISITDPDMGPGFRVHEIPFQFNLMKLLPRCQQVEMFFLMLTKGRCLFITCLPLSSVHGCGQPAPCACLPGQQRVSTAKPLLVAQCCSSQLCSPRAVQLYCCLSWDDNL